AGSPPAQPGRQNAGGPLGPPGLFRKRAEDQPLGLGPRKALWQPPQALPMSVAAVFIASLSPAIAAVSRLLAAVTSFTPAALNSSIFAQISGLARVLPCMSSDDVPAGNSVRNLTESAWISFAAAIAAWGSTSLPLASGATILFALEFSFIRAMRSFTGSPF